jgi:polysaccharide export outer membrane protein|eukprot:gene12421-12508_t
MFKKSPAFAFAILVAILFSSCASYTNIPYFEDLKKNQNTTEDITNFSNHIIQPKDELLIHVTSLNPEASSVFNNNLQTSPLQSNTPVYDYLVDQDGNVELPLIGKVKVTGLTSDQVSAQLSESLGKYLKVPRVSVRIINFKVAVLGDVARPNVYTSFSDRLTIPEALSLAGDLNITADRNILLVREINNKREFYHIDLQSKNLFESPYFYMKSNDLLFVQPGKLKVSTIETNGYRNASIVVTALSVIVTSIYLIIHK